MKRIILLLLIVPLFSSCFQHYYKTNSRTSADATQVEKLKAENKYFIIHYNDKITGTQNVNLTQGSMEFSAVTLPKEHSYYISASPDKPNVVRIKHKATTLKEVHLYTNTSFPANENNISLPFASINRMDIYEFDQKATDRNRTWSIIGLGTATVGTILIIYLSGDWLNLNLGGWGGNG
jgi:hypothetical protein